MFVPYILPNYKEYTIIYSDKATTRDSNLLNYLEKIFKKKKEFKDINKNNYQLTLKEAIYKILEAEAPIHKDDCLRRIQCNFNNSRLFRNYYDYYRQILYQELKSKNIIIKNDFLYLPNTKILVRNRSKLKYEDCGPGILVNIPEEEIQLAAYEIIKIEFGIEEKELVKLMGKYLGTPCLSNIQNILNNIKSDKNIILQNNKFYYSNDKIYIPSPNGKRYKPLEKIKYQVFKKEGYFSSREKQNIMRSNKLIELIHDVLLIEAPIHEEDCFNRITKYLSLKSAKDYYYTYKRYLKNEIIRGKIIEKNNFLYLPNTKIIVRNRNNSEYENYYGKIQIKKIPPEEIQLIAINLIENSTSVNEEDLVKYISKEIGFSRTTQHIRKSILEVLESLKSNNKIIFKNNLYILNK